MKVRSVMRSPGRAVSQTESIGHAATMLANCKTGALAVVDNGILVGIVTERDLTMRGLAAGLREDTPVAAVMTPRPIVCRPDDELADALDQMRGHRIRRLPVCTPQGGLIGVLSINDAAQEPEYGAEAAETLASICGRRGRQGQASHPA